MPAPPNVVPVEAIFGLPTRGRAVVCPDGNTELYRTLERFLARHLGGRSANRWLVSQ